MVVRARLGRGKVRVAIMNRGGAGMFDLPAAVDGHFTREWCATSEARLTIPYGGDVWAHRSLELANIRKWQHEVAFTWDGRIVWCGPIVDLHWDPDQLEIAAADLSAWWGKRVVLMANHRETDVTTMAVDYHNIAMSVDDSPNMHVTAVPSDKYATKQISGHAAYVADLIAELADEGLQWTVIGRHVLFGPVLGDERRFNLTGAHFAHPPSVSEVGDDDANSIYVKLSNSNLIVGEAHDPVRAQYEGVLAKIVIDDSVTSQQEADRRAAEILAEYAHAVYMDLDQLNSLNPSAPVALDELIPGAVARIDLTGPRDLSGFMRLTGVQVTGDGTVSARFAPLAERPEDGV